MLSKIKHLIQWFKNKNWSIFILAFIVFFIWQSPFLGKIRFPFMLLGTWFHEMGHGITASVLGVKFNYLIIFSNGGGFANITYIPQQLFLPQNITSALISFGGLIGPCIMGAVLIICGSRQKSSKIILIFLITSIIISLIFWVRSTIGIITLGLITIALSTIVYTNHQKIIQWTVLFLGLQSTLSTYLQLDYLFTSSFERDGKQRISDTQSIANNLFGTYWMWAILIICISLFILWKSYAYYLRKQISNNRK